MSSIGESGEVTAVALTNAGATRRLAFRKPVAVTDTGAGSGCELTVTYRDTLCFSVFNGGSTLSSFVVVTARGDVVV